MGSNPEQFFTSRHEEPDDDRNWVRSQDLARALLSHKAYAVRSLAQAVLSRPDTLEILAGIPEASEHHLETAIARIRRLARRHTIRAGVSEFLKVPGRESPIARAAIGDGELRLVDDPQTLLTEMERQDRSGRVYLAPGTVHAYPVSVDPGAGWQPLTASMVERAALVADWIQPAKGSGYIFVSVLSDTDRIWTPESEHYLLDRGIATEQSKWLAAVLDAWNVSHPLDGGAWGQGRNA